MRTSSQDTTKYYVYVRKSSEDKKRQALSIPAQKDKLTESFGHLDLEFIEESRSAFKPNNRPEFERMLTDIRRRRRTGLIAWSPDRLSRNEKDAGEITYLIRSGVIKDLKFGTYHFENSPEGIWMLQMALSQSQYESAKKGRDVKRGLQKKCEMGIYPAPAPLGYINVEDLKTKIKRIKPDPDRFDRCRDMVDMMLTGLYTPPQIWRIATSEWRMRGPRGQHISRSNVYRLFTNPFYYGEFEYPLGSSDWYKGEHQPLMTRCEYDKIQIFLGRPSQTRAKTRDFPYRGPLRCGECGAMITAEAKVKRQKNGNVHHYTYYHCTKRIDPDCTQRSIREEELEAQITRVLEQIEIPSEFRAFALSQLARIERGEPNKQEATKKKYERDYRTCLRRLDTLIDMRVNGELTVDQFKERKAVLERDRVHYKAVLDGPQVPYDGWFDFAESRLRFAETSRATFKDAGIGTRRQILNDLGSNLRLIDKKLVFDWDYVLKTISDEAERVRALHDRLEPPKGVAAEPYYANLYAQNPRMLRVVHKVRTCRNRQSQLR